MSLYEPFSADGFHAEWSHGDHTEVLDARWDNEAWTVSMKIGGADVEAVVRCSPSWDVQQMLLFRDLAEPDLWLGHDGTGRWGEVGGAHRPDLDGAFDLWLPVSAFGHTLPVRRLDLAVGESARLNALDIDVEHLGVVSRPFLFSRLAAHEWRIEHESSVVEFAVDRHGVPHHLGPFQRTT